MVGLLGPNGAGKTTTIRMLTGYLPPTKGRASVAGFDSLTQSVQARSNLGYLPESNALYPEMRVQEYLRYRGRLYGLRGAELGSAAVVSTWPIGSASGSRGTVVNPYRWAWWISRCTETTALGPTIGPRSA